MLALIPIVLALQIRVQVDTRRADTVSKAATEAADSIAGDTTRRRRGRQREARRIPLTAAHLASAYRDATARTLVERARVARMAQDSSLRGYDASSVQRISAGMSLRETGRGRLLFRSESSARIRWDRTKGAWIDLTGARTVAPMFKGTEAEVEVNDEMPAPEMISLPYFPGRETLWLPVFGESGQLAAAEVDDRAIVHPIAEGAEAYYTYRTGDAMAIRLAEAQGTVRLRELIVESREPRWNAIVGSFWFDIETGQLARAAYRLSTPMDIWEVATEADGEDPRDEIPVWVLPMLSPMSANISAIAIEYGLHEGRFWLPRVQSAEGKVRAGMMHIPFKVEEKFRYASVNGDAMDSLPPAGLLESWRRRDVADSLVMGLDSAAADSVRREVRKLRRQDQCRTSDTRVVASDRYDGAVAVATRIPCDTTVLSKSPDLPPSIYDEGEEVFGTADMDDLIQTLTIGLQPGWAPKPIEIMLARERGQARYNRIEGLSAGIGARQVLGQGFTAEGVVRLGHADLEPNAELLLHQVYGQQTIQYGLYRRLEAANDWGTPFGFGASLSTLLFGRDEGFYYRTAGAEVVGNFDRGSLLTLRLFAEDQRDADVETHFSLANAINGLRMMENIEASEGALVGASLRSRGSRGLDPQGLRTHSDFRLEIGQGREGYGRAAMDVTVSRGLGRYAASITGGGGASVGDLPVQRLWFLGGSRTVRGQRAGSAAGDAYWLGRAEVGTNFVLARPVVFYDVGWAGDRTAWRNPGQPLSGAGVGVSVMDGLLRFDLSRGIAPRQELRFDMYLEARF